jgi:hypothetical protein
MERSTYHPLYGVAPGSFLASEIPARKFFKFYSNRLERMMVRARFARCCWYDHQALGLGLRGLGNALRNSFGEPAKAGRLRRIAEGIGAARLDHISAKAAWRVWLSLGGLGVFTLGEPAGRYTGVAATGAGVVSPGISF